MPRRSSGRRSSSSGPRGYGSRQYHSSPRPTPTPIPMRTSTSPGMGLGSAMATGMAFGGGSAMGHQVVRSLMGPQYGERGGEVMPSGRDQNVPTDVANENVEQSNYTQKQNPCMPYNMDFVNCLQTNPSDISKCQNLFENLVQCQKQLR